MKDKEMKPQVLDTLEASKINRETINSSSIPKLGPVKIPINEHYLLGADQPSWYIAKKRTRKGEESWENIKWYSTLEHAADGLFQLMVRTSGATTEYELLQAVTRSRNEIRSAFKHTFTLWTE
jgi:hypothetical protein